MEVFDNVYACIVHSFGYIVDMGKHSHKLRAKVLKFEWRLLNKLIKQPFTEL